MAKLFSRLALLIAIGFVVFWLSKRGSSARPLQAMTPARAAAPAATAAAQPQPARPQSANVQELTQKLLEFSRPQSSLEKLIQYLKSIGQEPQITRDKNPSTGELTIVRALHPLPGTRYLHAQFFANEDGSHRFLQHLSFEIPPGPEALAHAAEALESAFPGLGQPIVHAENLLEWEAGDGYIVWAKKLGERDLADNPWNTYTPADAGTVRIAIELKPEED